MAAAAACIILTAMTRNQDSSQAPAPEVQPQAPAAQSAGEAADVTVDVVTTLGPLRLKLYGATPKHRDNFVKLVEEGYYDGLLFHRVIDQFMIQTGDPDSRDAAPGRQLGSGGPGYQVDAEIVCPRFFNKRGALAAARTGDQVNPERKSSGSQFYIVTGRKFTPAQLDQMEGQMQQGRLQEIFDSLAREHMGQIRSMQAAGDQAGLQALQQQLVARTEEIGKASPFRFSAEQREAYTTVGGAPHLDGAYTVFGEVVSGMDTVDKIEKAETDRSDRPLSDVRIISMKIVK